MCTVYNVQSWLKNDFRARFTVRLKWKGNEHICVTQFINGTEWSHEYEKNYPFNQWNIQRAKTIHFTAFWTSSFAISHFQLCLVYYYYYYLWVPNRWRYFLSDIRAYQALWATLSMCVDLFYWWHEICSKALHGNITWVQPQSKPTAVNLGFMNKSKKDTNWFGKMCFKAKLTDFLDDLIDKLKMTNLDNRMLNFVLDNIFTEFWIELACDY